MNLDTDFLGKFATKHRILTNAMRKWYLENHGTKVGVKRDSSREMRDWCSQNCIKLWDYRDDDHLISFSELLANAEMAITGEFPENWVEYSQSNILMKELGYGISKSSFEGNFWFENIDEAILFKLTWAGDI